MASNDSTMKFRADISQLKAAMQQASRAIRVANSEFKAATSCLDDWSSSATGLQSKLNQLDSVLKAQKKQVELANEEYEKTVAVYGKNSAEADRAKIALNNYTAAVAKTESQIASYTQKLEEVNQASGDMGDLSELDRQKANVKEMESALDGLKQKYASLQLEERDTGEESEELAKEIEQLSSELKKSKTDIANAEKAADDLDQSLDETGDSAKTASDGFTVMKGALADLVADGIRLAIRAAKDLAKETFDAGANFESAMSQVGAVSGASEEDLTKLTAKAKEMGESTKFSATEAAEAFNYMAMAGWKTEDMVSGIEGIMHLAAASGADLATTSDIVTDALTAMGYGAGDAGRLADVMAAASSNANTNVELMGQTFQYAATIVGSLGYSMEDTAVAIGMMANAGIKGDKAGTALRSVLTRLSAPPKECAEAMEELGITLTDEQGNMKDLDTVMKDLRKAFDGLSETQQTQYAKSLAGQQAMSGLLAIVNGADADFNKLTKAVAESNGAAQEMADTMVDNVSGDLTLLQSQIEGKMIKVFEKASPRIRAAIHSISRVLDNVNWDAVADRVGLSIEKLVDLFNWMIQHGNGVATTLKIIGTAIGTAFVVDKVATFKNNMLTLIPALTKVTTATEGATVATKLLGVAQTALPWVALAAGVAAVTGAVAAYARSQEDAARAEYELTDKQLEAVSAVNDARQAIDDLAEARNQAIANANGEFNYLNQLTDEYNSLIDSNGKVKKGYEDRAEFILTTLANSLGVERSEIDKNIGKNGELKQSINDLIEAQRAQAYLSAHEAEYQNAIENRDSAIQEYGAALRTLDEAEQAYNQTQEKAKQALEEYNKLLESSPEQAYRYRGMHSEIFAANDEAVESYNKAKQAVADAEQNYIDYNNTIANYEGLSAAIISGDQQKISQALDAMQSNFITSQNGTREILEQQLADFEEKYYNMQAAVNAGMPGVTQAEVDAMSNMVDQAKAELDKLPPEAEESGKEAGNAHATGVSSTKGATKKAAETVGKATESGLKSGDKNTKKTGQDAGSAYAKGVESKKSAAKKAGETVGKEVDSGAKSGETNLKKQGEKAGDEYNKGIDSKKGTAKTKGQELGDNAKTGAGSVNPYSSGEYFGQGFINGINAKQSQAYNAGYQLGKKSHEGLKKGQQEGSPSKLTYKSGVYFVQGYINGISSMQKSLVKTVQNMVGTVVKELGKMSGFNFSDVAKNASTKFADAMTAKTSYMLAKMQYQNEKKVKEFDTTISKLEKQRDAKSTKLQAASDKRVKALETQRDNTSNKDAKARLKKQIDAEKANAKKLIKANESQYKKLINEQNKLKTAYQTASSNMLSEFQTAVNQYQQKAQALIDDTINGITEKYNQRYNELINKQNSLIDKLKSAGDLFDVSGAGVMTVNDLKEQTAAINDYAKKLQKIKGKVSSELFDQIASYDMTQGSAFMDRLLSMSADDLDAYNKAYTEKMEAAQKAGNKIYKSDFNKIASDYKKELETAFKGIDKRLKELGTQAMKGFVNGLTKNTNYMDKNVKLFVKSMVDTFKKQLKIKSPSRVMFGIGEYTGEGFNDGLMSMVKGIQKTAGELANAVNLPLEDLTGDITGLRSAVNQPGTYTGTGTSGSVVNNYNLVQNNNSPKALTALETYQARRRQIAMMKAATMNA